jgi:hypothetical protein
MLFRHLWIWQLFSIVYSRFLLAMTWSSLNGKRKRKRQNYEFIPLNGVRYIRIHTYLSILYSQRTLQPCTTQFKNYNTHVRRISLPQTKRQAARRHETGALRAVQRSIVEIFSFKQNENPAGAEKHFRSTPQHSIAPSVFKKQGRIGIGSDNKQCLKYTHTTHR